MRFWCLPPVDISGGPRRLRRFPQPRWRPVFSVYVRARQRLPHTLPMGTHHQSRMTHTHILLLTCLGHQTYRSAHTMTDSLDWNQLAIRTIMIVLARSSSERSRLLDDNCTAERAILEATAHNLITELPLYRTVIPVMWSGLNFFVEKYQRVAVTLDQRLPLSRSGPRRDLSTSHALPHTRGTSELNPARQWGNRAGLA